MAAVSPADRSAAVVTTGCGSAPAAVGSAVLIDGDRLLTAAHVVAGAEQVALLMAADLPGDRSWPALAPSTLLVGATPASVVAFDPDLDLALIEIGDDGTGSTDRSRSIEPPPLDLVSAGSPVTIHGVTNPDPIDGIVAERTIIVADQVRGSERVRRDGYRLDTITGRGDSGAGVWSGDGRLVGLVFAVSSDAADRTWAVSSKEIERFLNQAEASPPSTFVCDQSQSRLTPTN